MKSSAQTARTRVYSGAFVTLILALLTGFLTVPGLSLSGTSPTYRWRLELIRLFETFRLRAGDHVFNIGVVGHGGWLFLMDQQSATEYQRSAPLNRKTLASLQIDLDQLNSELSSQGKTLLVVICPDKSTIYPQFVPGEIQPFDQPTRLDQFTSYMRSHGQARVLDLRPALTAGAASDDVYYKTDTHWNDLGAYYGYLEILRALSSDYPALSARLALAATYVPTQRIQETTDLPRIMGLYPFQETGASRAVDVLEPIQTIPVKTENGLVVRLSTNPNLDLPKLLILHDSFYDSLAQYIEPSFSQVTAVPYGSGAEALFSEWIKAEAPDVVIIERAERTLELLPRYLENHDT
jgi:alginate O-acetyltransferase complex protein AlgJ